MPISLQLLEIIGRRHPDIYDFVIPRGPMRQFSEVALNPQPLPPDELRAAIAIKFIYTGWLTERFGLEVDRLSDDLENWCPTPPALPQLPPWWPPLPEPEWSIAFHLGFAARLAERSAQFENTRFGMVIEKALDRSIAVLESANG